MLIERTQPAAVDADEILRGLNGAFGAWGGRRMFDWALARTCAGLQPDLLVVREEGQIVAFAANMYRRIRSARGELSVVAVIGAAWTAPHVRGRGLFTGILRESVAVASDRGALAVLGFLRAASRSRAAFERLGASFAFSAYARSSGGSGEPPIDFPEVAADEGMFRAPSAMAHFHYLPDEWRAQFIERTEPVVCLDPGNGCVALVETVPEFDRVMAVSAPDEERELETIDLLTRRAHGRSRRLFTFTTSAQMARALGERGFEIVPGAVAVVPAHDPGPWFIRNGDRV